MVRPPLEYWIAEEGGRSGQSQFPALPQISSMALGKSLSLYVSDFPHLYNEDNSTTLPHWGVENKNALRPVKGSVTRVMGCRQVPELSSVCTAGHPTSKRTLQNEQGG